MRGCDRLDSLRGQKVEDACASSSVAFRNGVLAIASGIYDVVLVGGTEK